MVKKCCMVNCTTNYDRKKGDQKDGQKIPVFRFPTDEEERKKWLEICSRVRADLKVSSETVICELHWPKDYQKIRKKGYDRPALPPSIFPGIPSSIVPEPLPTPRETKRASNQLRNTIADEIDQFEKMDRLIPLPSWRSS